MLPSSLLLVVFASGVDTSGLDLLVEHRCVACHAPPAELAERLPVLPASVLDGVGARVRRDWLNGFLRGGGPHAPDLLLGLSASEHPLAKTALIDLLAARGGPFETAAPAVDPGVLELGRQLYHAVGCVACHAPFEVPLDLERPLWSFSGGVEGAVELLGGLPLDHLVEKTGHEALAAYLRDPLSVRPSGEMPSLRLDEKEARALAAYLLSPESRGDGSGFDYAPGLVAEYFEADDPSNVGGMQPTRVDVARELAGIDTLPPHRDEAFAFRFRGFAEVPAAGMWRFTTASDDGSRLRLDGEPLVDNWGDHPVVRKSGERWLDAGRHALEVDFYERGGGQDLIVSWSGPGVDEAPIPAEALGHWKSAAAPKPFRDADPMPSGHGPAFFARLRCGACHALEGMPPPALAPTLIALDPRASTGCLAGDAAGGGPSPTSASDAPRYELSAAERAALIAALERLRDPRRDMPPHVAHDGTVWEGVAGPRDDAAELERTLARLDCRACHARGGAGAPDEERGLYFTVKGDLDLGDEGRLPPSLDRVGWKLQPAALEGILLRGEGVRPYMRTRMPDFGAENVGHLPALFTTLDAHEPADDVGEPAFDARDVELGRQLAGREALGCIQCHDLAGNAGLGIPAADLAYVHERIRYGWFRELLLTPEAVGMSSRMPYFYADGQSSAVDVYGGDPARQVDALWTWLSLGAALPLPDGVAIDANEYELVPLDRTITCGVFFQGASARCVVVGTPERVHYAYDVENCSLVAAWKGRFFNAEGTWHGRAGRLEEPMGEDAIRFARGVPFCPLLPNAERPWAWPTERAEELGYRVLGRRVTPDGRPTFRYSFPARSGSDGVPSEVVVEERIEPIVMPGAMGLRRTLTCTTSQDQSVYLRVAVGEHIEKLEQDGNEIGEEYLVDGHLRVRVLGGLLLYDGRIIEVAPRAGTVVELVVPTLVQPDEPVGIEVELRW